MFKFGSLLLLFHLTTCELLIDISGTQCYFGLSEKIRDDSTNLPSHRWCSNIETALHYSVPRWYQNMDIHDKRMGSSAFVYQMTIIEGRTLFLDDNSCMDVHNFIDGLDLSSLEQELINHPIFSHYAQESGILNNDGKIFSIKEDKLKEMIKIPFNINNGDCKRSSVSANDELLLTILCMGLQLSSIRSKITNFTPEIYVCNPEFILEVKFNLKSVKVIPVLTIRRKLIPVDIKEPFGDNKEMITLRNNCNEGAEILSMLKTNYMLQKANDPGEIHKAIFDALGRCPLGIHDPVFSINDV